MQIKSKYTASFTAGALLFQEFNSVIPFISGDNLYILLQSEVRENKYLAIKTESARKRIIQEMLKRAGNAPDGFWSFYKNIPEAEQKLALFYLCLKTYYLLFDFHFEVAVPKWKLHANELDIYDIQMRLDRIASADETVYHWADQTKEKVISRYRKILTESGLLQKDRMIRPISIRNEFWHYFIGLNEPWFIEACFYNVNEI
jgi:hypothetical protein